MAIERYDIFQMDNGQIVWIECTETIESLRSRLADLQKKHAHLMVYDTQTDSKWNPVELSNLTALDKS